MLYHAGMLTKKDTLGTRIKAARYDETGKRRFTQSEVAAWFGIKPQAVYEWEKDKSRPGIDKIGTLATRTGKTVEFFVEVYGDIPSISIANVVASLQNGRERRRVPEISYVQAGRWKEIADPYEVGDARDWLRPDKDVSDTAFALEIKGDSMEPEFHDGDKVIIDPAVQPRPGNYVVAKLYKQDEATFKQYRLRGIDANGDIIDLVPLNDNHPTLRIDADNPGEIVGTMVEHRRFRRS